MARRLFKHTIKALLALFMSGTLTCCFDYDSVEMGQDAADGDEYCMYFKFESTSGSSNTRASGFLDGEHDEHKIGDTGNFAVFFDENKNYVLTADLRLKDHEEITDDNGADSDIPSAGNKEEAVYRTRFYRAKKADMPRYVLVVLNGNNVRSALSDIQKGTPLSEVTKKFWEASDNPTDIGFDYEAGKGKLFTMTSSIYAGHDATEIEERYVQKLSEVYDPTKIIKIYVERMVAKFSFTEQNNNHPDGVYSLDGEKNAVMLFTGEYNKDLLADADDHPDDPGEPVYDDINERCKIRVTGWGINALETKSHIFKNIDSEDAWNNESHYRNLWSTDPHYDNTDQYPWQYRSAIENENLVYYGEEKNSPLRNYSYNDFAGNKENNVVYVPENTYDPKYFCDKKTYPTNFLDNRTNVLAGTHLIVCAQIEIDGKPVKHLYRDKIYDYYKTKKECFAELIRQFNRDLMSQDTMVYHYYYWDKNADPVTEIVKKEDGTEVKETAKNGTIFIAKPSGGYRLYYDNKPFTYQTVIDMDFPKDDDGDIILPQAEILNGDGKLLPWIDEIMGGLEIKSKDGTEKLQIYDKRYSFIGEKIQSGNMNNNSENSISQEPLRYATSNDIKSLLLEWLGAIEHFNEGKMYYDAGVKHKAAYSDANYTVKQQTLGDYGVVRNSWYQLNLDNIEGIGKPVSVPEQPIVPNRVDTNEKLNFKVEIINWHEIETILPIL